MYLGQGSAVVEGDSGLLSHAITTGSGIGHRRPGLGLLAYALDAKGVKLPDGVLLVAIIAGGLMFLSGIALEVRAHWKSRPDARPASAAMVSVRGRVDRAEQRRNRGHMLDADSVGNLLQEDNVGSDEPLDTPTEAPQEPREPPRRRE